jgi:glycosyltransferase involved in cell wall biosynthesis
LFPVGGDQQVSVIYNGFLTERELAIGRRRLASRTQPVRKFVIIGGIGNAKAQVDAVRALAIARRDGLDFSLVIAGSGDPADVLRLIAALGLSNVAKVIGYTDDVWRTLTEADALLMCSKHEPFGRVTVEAMAAGVPVIGFAGGATPEIITDGLSGLLYHGSHDDLAAKMVLLAKQPAMARKMSRRAWHEAARRFTTSRCADEICDVFITVIGERRDPAAKLRARGATGLRRVTRLSK